MCASKHALGKTGQAGEVGGVPEKQRYESLFLGEWFNSEALREKHDLTIEFLFRHQSKTRIPVSVK